MKIRISTFDQDHQILEDVIDKRNIGIYDNSFNNKIIVKLLIDKSYKCWKIHGILETKIVLTCDRCLELFDLYLSPKIDIIISTDKVLEVDSENVIYFQPGTDEIDISENLRDYLLLSIPIKKNCTDECKGLCPSCGINLNKKSCKCHDDSIDPRWDNLKNLK